MARMQRSTTGQALAHAILMVALLVAPARLRGQGASAPFITVQVRDTAGAPLLNAIVELSDAAAGTVVRRLTDVTGAARLPQTHASAARIEVRRMGFRRESVEWQPGKATIGVQLRPVPQALARVDVRVAPSRCQPGYIPHDADSTLRQVIEGIDVYARQEAALDEQSPWLAEWSFAGTDHDADDQVVSTYPERRYRVDSRTDTLRYARGRMVQRRGLSWIRARYERVRDLTLPEFLDNHCFALSAEPDTALGRPALHLRFRADRTIRSTDTDGSVMLDPKTLAPLKAVFRWVHLPPGFADGEEVVRFCEVLPGVLAPVERRFWQRYSTPLYVRDARVEWSRGIRTMRAMRWQGDPPPSGLSPSLAACQGDGAAAAPVEGRGQ